MRGRGLGTQAKSSYTFFFFYQYIWLPQLETFEGILIESSLKRMHSSAYLENINALSSILIVKRT